MGIGLQLKVEPFGLERARNAVHELLKKGGNLKSPLDISGRYLVTRTHEHFRAESSPEGTPWKSLSQPYINRPRAKGGRGGHEHPILFLSGLMMASITHQADAKSLAVGSNRRFPGGTKSALAIHQLGGTAGRGAHIPARPFLGVTERDADRIGDFMIAYLTKI